MAIPTPRGTAPGRWCACATIGALLACGQSGDGSTSSADARVAAAEEIAFGSVEEMEFELETLDHEIRGLEEYLAANPGWTPPDPSDPGDREHDGPACPFDVGKGAQQRGARLVTTDEGRRAERPQRGRRGRVLVVEPGVVRDGGP